MSQTSYNKHFSDNGFRKKVNTLPSSAGSKVLRQAVTLYVLLKDRDVPNLVKVSIIGALGYFIFPFDLVPDFIPVAGYLDDLGLMAALVRQLYVYTTPEIMDKVNALMPAWAKQGESNV